MRTAHMTPQVLANNRDRNGRAFVAVVEGRDGLPVWATQVRKKNAVWDNRITALG